MDTLPAQVSIVARRFPSATAIVEGTRKIDYQQFIAQAKHLCRRLVSSGLQPGGRVAILLPNQIEAAVAFYGIWMAGGIAVPLNVQAKARDIDPWLVHCGANHLIHDAGNPEAILALQRADAPLIPVPVETGPVADDDAFDDATAGPSLADPASPALILYTSGTTGAPKGVTLSHRNLVANARAVVSYLQLQAHDKTLSALPFYYAYGSSVLHTHLLSGACIQLMDNLLFPHLLAEHIDQHRVTGFSGVPSTFALLLDRVRLQDYDLSSLRYITQAGGAMRPELTRRVRDAFPSARLFVMYGQTEATSRLTWLPPNRLEDKLGSVGIPIDGVQIGVFTDDGNQAACGLEGEVCVRGDNVMLGYWNSPEATAQVLRGGWLHTGDIGRIDQQGFLYLSGRRSDMIKTGAHRVFPGDIEEAISEIPGVVETAVVGVEDEILGQAIKAYVVASPQAPPSINAIKAHCRNNLAAYKIPKYIAFVDELPRTASGKTHRAALQQPRETA